MSVRRIIPPHADHAKFTTAVGEALHQWSMVEMQLASLFVVISRMPDYTAGQAAMAAVVSFEARLQVCNAVLMFLDLSDFQSKYWTRLFNRLLKKLKKRNELAHFSIVELHGPEGIDRRLMPYFSVGNAAVTHKRRGVIGVSLTLEEVRLRGIHFHLLAEEVAWFTREMQIVVGTHSTNDGPVPDLVHQLRSEGDQTPEGK